MKEKIFKVISQELKISLELLNENFSNVNIESWDSLKHIKIMIALEKEFNCRFLPNEITQMLDYKSIRDIIQKKIHQ